jgi:hypothetical protein
MATRRKWILTAAGLGALVVIAVLTIPITLTPGVRAKLTAALEERFDSDVELESLRVSMLPRLRVAGTGVVLRHRGRTDVPPLIAIPAFSAEATLWGLLGEPLRLSRVHLEGLEINIPPGGMSLDDDKPKPDDDAEKETDAKAPPPPDPRRSGATNGTSPLVVEDLLSERAVLKILRRETGKTPRIFEIAHLSMQRVGADDPWPFRAELTNPTPPGEIAVEGTFGPWNAGEPSGTALAAKYEFRDADLGVFKGIRGILQSDGAFNGVLERIEVDGTADVPEFALDAVGQPVRLTTKFSAVVDGTNGNTWLRPVNATLGESPIVANGGVVEKDGQDGRTITLDIVMSEARIEDVLRLAVKGAEPPMTGALELKTSFLLPPGDRDAIEKLQLDGSFKVASGRFAKGSVQAKMNELSQKARGEGNSGDPAEQVVSNFTGRFVMKDGAIHFSTLTFAVPGARVNLAGTFALRSEALDFRGTVRLDAKLSELTTGVKSFLLKAVDPLVRSKDVTVIPITVRGTAQKPDFGLDIKRAFAPK